MMRTSASTSLQNIYDECYMTCSTAVYFESKNNEAEALRSWKTALNRIYQYNATRGSIYNHQPPATEIDRTLLDSLRQLELQCRERVDLLEALQESRQEAGEQTATSTADGPAAGLGGGTVPPIVYSELSRPPLPPRRKSSGEPSRSNIHLRPHSSNTHSASPSPSHHIKESRSPSPEKKTRMLRTLRSNNKEGSKSSSHKQPRASSSRPPVAAKAATLAFVANTSAKTTRPLYQSTQSSSEYLPTPPAVSDRASFERPRSGPAESQLLASSAAARSWSDLSTERLPYGRRQPSYSSQQQPSPNNSRTRVPQVTAPIGAVPVDSHDDTQLQRTRRLPQRRPVARKDTVRAHLPSPPPPDPDSHPEPPDPKSDAWASQIPTIMKNLPRGIDETAAQQLLNEIVIHGDEVHWDDIAGLEVAKSALKENVVYPFLRPDLFSGLREPARGILLFGPPGTGKTMLARAVATESKSTFFAISASSLTSKFLGESEKLVRALFALAKLLAPSIIFVDEIDSLLSSRSGTGEHEATRRIKTEFLIQWSDLQKAAAGRETSEKDKERGDASRVLVLAATNLPWAIDEAARRRFVRRQYIPLPEPEVRKMQFRTLLRSQNHELGESEMEELVRRTDGFSGSDITALAKDAAMGPLRSLGEKLLETSMDEIRPIRYEDFERSLERIRPSVSRQGLKEYEDWANEFGERGG
ncbi:AAA-domain-containing protein [Sporormia fimetaria CBS 119925]|uniref:AAA-domain-containing protein n=1 Tax=Sporormia fimetaria CBS 119925 TaxID=1340428 RepID=A0A6A6VNR0_9PLEO|nr:AAA-domain-containing protein [Sporormia fimetaria CBS 119925]